MLSVGFALVSCPSTKPRAVGSSRLERDLAGLLSFFDERPAIAHMVVVGSLAAGKRVLERRCDLLEGLAEAVDGARAEIDPLLAPPPLTAEGLVGAVLSVIHTRLLEADPRPLVELAAPLTSMIVHPYLGTDVAQRELEREAPPSVERDERPVGSASLTDLGIRLTYRTALVLGAIATLPGASNRRIAESAGVSDLGQISKLLRRLERNGLAVNASDGRARGGANAWQLTPRGRSLLDVIAPAV
jgi:DNA-binding MarR family transcriptional regulator